MDPDSFLNLLSPELLINDFHAHSAAAADQEEDEEDEEEEAEAEEDGDDDDDGFGYGYGYSYAWPSNVPSLNPNSSPHCEDHPSNENAPAQSTPPWLIINNNNNNNSITTTMNSSSNSSPISPPVLLPDSPLSCYNSSSMATIAENASTYSSVLKLSAIASALPSFSMKAANSHPTTTVPNSSSVTTTTTTTKTTTATTTITANSRGVGCKRKMYNYGDGDGDDSDGDCDGDFDGDGDGDGEEEEDVKPLSHVKIIRRPNSSTHRPQSNSNNSKIKHKNGKDSRFSRSRSDGSHIKADHGPEEGLGGGQCKAGAAARRRREKEAGGHGDGDGDGDGGAIMSQREVHILSERQRRKSMRESFSILQSLIPKLKLKHTDRITVLTEVITYIQSLWGTLQELEQKKVEMMDLLGVSGRLVKDEDGDGHHVVVKQPYRPTNVTYIVEDEESMNVKGHGDGDGDGDGELQQAVSVEVTVRICGADVFITLNIPRRKGVWSGVLMLLQKRSVEISNATLTTAGTSSFHCIHGKITDMARMEGVDLQEKLERVIVKELQRKPKKVFM